MNFELSVHNSIHDFDRRQWQRFSPHSPPFLCYEFLAALEDSDSVGGETGWQPNYFRITESNSGQDVAYLPAYVKTHSYGEYVFDHSWANAYHQHGIAYYPKLLIAVPFTPVTAAKLLVSPDFDKSIVSEWVFEQLPKQCSDNDYSSVHWLFDACTSEDQRSLYCQRHSVQFQWQNKDYQSFDEFLARFTSRKRKDIRKERSRIQQQGVSVTSLKGDEITPEDFAFFYQCYCDTYLKRSGHTGYLTKPFFDQIYATLRSSLMLVIARRGSHNIAAALYLFNHTGLYGRYWGALEDVNGLHFECCYYSGLEFAIDERLPMFNPGTQGEHKILRGFEPLYCYSWHHCVEPAFQTAIENFVIQEQKAMAQYHAQACSVVPFKQNIE